MLWQTKQTYIYRGITESKWYQSSEMDKYNLFTAYDEEDDLYSGFNEFHPTLNTSTLIQDSLSRDVKNQQSMIQVQQLTMMGCAVNVLLTPKTPINSELIFQIFIKMLLKAIM